MTAPVTGGDAEVTVACTELHCAEEHSDYGVELESERDRLRETLRDLITTYHETHDERFPWSLCSRDICRDAAIALGVRP